MHIIWGCILLAEDHQLTLFTLEDPGAIRLCNISGLELCCACQKWLRQICWIPLGTLFASDRGLLSASTWLYSNAAVDLAPAANAFASSLMYCPLCGMRMMK